MREAGIDIDGPGINAISADSALEHFNIISTHRDKGIDNNNCLFPVDVFPQVIQEIIHATNKDLTFPVDYIGASLLFASSVAIGNTYQVEVKREWHESAVLYMAIVGAAGTNKSHPLAFALKPIFNHDALSYKEYEFKRKEYEAAIKQLAKDKTDADDPIKPVWQKFLLTDYTPEALADVHKFNNRGIGVYADELAGWFKNFNRYNRGSEMEFWLSAFSGTPITIDRKSKDPIFIPLPFISVAGTIQKGILSELAKEHRTQNGFIDRILFVIPDNIQKPYWSETEIDPAIAVNWDQILKNLFSLSMNTDDSTILQPNILKYTPEAKQLLTEWQIQNTDECNNTTNEAVSGICSKIEMYVIRLSLILELMNWACESVELNIIGRKATEGAIRLGEYFKKSAIKVNQIISNYNPVAALHIDKRTLYESLPKKFTTGQGVKIAEEHEIPERTFKDFITNNELFDQLKHGNYQKRF